MPNILSSEMEAFLDTWKVKHRLSSAYFPQSNGRGEVAVKSAKRLLRDHCRLTGRLDTDGYMLAIMAHRNTNNPETKMSPAKVIYGRRLTDAFMSATDKFSDEAVQPTWRMAWELKERANRHHFYSQREQTNKTARPLATLPPRAKVFIQNQHGAQAGAWDKTGTVTEQLPHASYSVKVDGSGRISQQTRQHLLLFIPHDNHAAHT